MSTQNYKGPIHLTKDMFDTLMSTGSVVDEQGVTHTYEDGHEYITDEIDYVDLESSQDVNGVKTFSDGIKLGSDGTTLTGVENNTPALGSTKAITSGAVYSALSGKGTVSSVAIRNGSTSQGTLSISGSPITSSGTIDVTLADNYGDTKNPYSSKTSNYVLAAPNGSNGVPSFRALTKTDLPSLSASDVGAAPISHASAANTYGLGTTSNYGHVKLATGDMNNATGSDGVACGKNHTHGQYMPYGTVLMPTNPFGGKHLYINTIDNAFASADKKFYVTITRHSISSGGVTYPYVDSSKSITDDDYFVDGPVVGTLTSSAHDLFNGSYEGGLSVSDGQYMKIRIMFGSNTSPSASTSYFPGYPYGVYYLSYYYTSVPTRVSQYRVYNKFSAHTVGWHSYNFSAFNGSLGNVNYIEQIDDEGNYLRTCVEFIIFGRSGGTSQVTEVDYRLTRPDLSRDGSTLTKYGSQSLYHQFTWYNDHAETAKITSAGYIYGTTFYENGTSLGNKYLGKTAKAADADKLDGHDSTYYQKALPTTTTAGKVLKSTSTAGTVVWGDDGDTDTWRKIQLNGVDKLGTAISTNPLNIVPGNYMSITESSGAFTFAVNADDIVTANPSGAGTTDLTKLKVGNTVYNIPSGGSNLPITVVDYSTSGVTFNFDDYTTPGLYFVTDYSFNNGPSFITTTSVDNSYTFWLEVEYDQSLNVRTQKVDFGNNIGIRSVAGDTWGSWSERNYGYIPTAVNSGTSITDLNKITINGITYNVEKPPKLLTCSTAATTYSKTVSYTNFRLVTGSIITVKFTNAHNSSTAATLNVNSTGAKTIVWDNTGYTITASGDSSKMNSWQAGETLTLAYDGSYWRIIARSKPVVYSVTGSVPAVYNDFVEVAYFRAAAGKVYSVTANIQASIGDSGTMGAYLEVYTPSGTQLAQYIVRGVMNAGGGLSISVISSDALSQTNGVYYRLKAYGYENATYNYYGYIQAVSVVE